MTPKVFRGATRRALSSLAAALLLCTAPAAAQQATTTATIRGLVTGPDGAPVNGATVIATNQETGVRRGAQTNESGRYAIPFLDPGVYTFRSQLIGFRPVEKPGNRVGLGQVQNVDFQLQIAPTQLSAQLVVADVAPLIEATKTGTSTRIDQQSITELPTNGRNFKDLVKLAPGVSDVGNTGSGGGQSIGGGRTGASNIMMDGTNNNESFFGGDARGGDRAPFSYSIEAVKEIQVITSATDVEYGNFTGGAVNAVTKSGTNKITGAAFGYFRQDELGSFRTTGRDFNGNLATDYERRQYGFSVGGPIVKDKAHFFFSLDKQTGNDPRLVYVQSGIGDASVRAAGINPDTLQNFLDIAQRVYGYDLRGEVGRFTQNTDQPAFFGRLDWQISNAHHLTVRDNYTKVTLSQDRLIAGAGLSDLLSNGGSNTDKSNSLVASLTSVLGSATNEFRAQVASTDKPRPSNPSGTFGVPLPQVRINNIRSILSDGSPVVTGVLFGADPVLHNNLLKTDVIEFIDNVRFTRGTHSFKVGGNFTKTSVFNRFQFNSLGTFQFASLADFENGIVQSYTRALAFPGKNAIDDARFSLSEMAAYAQDEWQVSPKLFVQYGVRYDRTSVSDAPAFNQGLTTSFPGVDVRNMPVDNDNFSPRVGFTFDPRADGQQVIRGSSSVIFGRNPYVTYSNVFANSGTSQTSLNCQGANAPRPDFVAYAADRSAIPTACIGAGAPPAAPDVNAFEEDYKQSYTFKNNLAYDRALGDRFRVTLETVVGTVRNNFLVQDDNLNAVPRFTIEGGIPVFVEASRVTSSGFVGSALSRRNANFNRVLVHRSIGSSVINQNVAQLSGKYGTTQLYFAYTNDNTRDNGSLGCCITGSMYGAGRSNGNPNDYDNQWGPATFQRRHTFVFSPNVELPYGFRVSGIMNYRSGTPWTPRYSSDINGDGNSGDRLYIPTAAQVSGYLFNGSTPEAQARQRTIFESRIESVECLRANRGKVADRNSCRNPWLATLDARVSKKFTTLRAQNVELQADLFNLFNLIDRDYGRTVEVSGTNEGLLSVRGFNSARSQFVYDVNPTFGNATPSDVNVTQQFQMQLGLRYNF